MPRTDPCARAVHLRGLVQILRHALQRRQEDDGHIPESPHGHQGDGWKCRVLGVDPLRGGQVEELENRVEDAGGGVVHPHPQDRVGDRGHQDRQVEDGAEEPDPVPDPVHEKRHAEGHDDRPGYGDQCVDHGGLERVQDLRVAEHLRVVVDTGPARAAADVPVGQADDDGCHHRGQREDQEADHCRSRETTSPAGLGSLETARFLEISGVSRFDRGLFDGRFDRDGAADGTHFAPRSTPPS